MDRVQGNPGPGHHPQVTGIQVMEIRPIVEWSGFQIVVWTIDLIVRYLDAQYSIVIETGHLKMDHLNTGLVLVRTSNGSDLQWALI